MGEPLDGDLGGWRGVEAGDDLLELVCSGGRVGVVRGRARRGGSAWADAERRVERGLKAGEPEEDGREGGERRTGRLALGRGRRVVVGCDGLGRGRRAGHRCWLGGVLGGVRREGGGGTCLTLSGRATLLTRSGPAGRARGAGDLPPNLPRSSLSSSAQLSPNPQRPRPQPASPLSPHPAHAHASRWPTPRPSPAARAPHDGLPPALPPAHHHRPPRPRLVRRADARPPPRLAPLGPHARPARRPPVNPRRPHKLVRACPAPLFLFLGRVPGALASPANRLARCAPLPSEADPCLSSCLR